VRPCGRVVRQPAQLDAEVLPVGRQQRVVGIEPLLGPGPAPDGLDDHSAADGNPAALREVGVKAELRRYQGMIHGFFQMTGALEGSRQLHRELGEWMHAHAGQARRTSQ
jgi:hypothetical protein